MTVGVLLEVRKAYLQSSQANVLKHWDLLQSRMRIATRVATSPEQWLTQLYRGLCLTGAPSVDSSICLVGLCTEIRERQCFRQWRQMLELEWGLLIARTRLAAEQKKEAKNDAAKNV